MALDVLSAISDAVLATISADATTRLISFCKSEAEITEASLWRDIGSARTGP